ncbi:hypothetical protein Tco_0250768 [Tanacetum coccineum]
MAEKTVPGAEEHPHRIANDISSTLICLSRMQVKCERPLKRLKQEPAYVIEDEEMQRKRRLTNSWLLISLSFKKIYNHQQQTYRTSTNTSRAKRRNSPESTEEHKPKRVKDAAYHKEKMLLCKQEEVGVQLNAEQADWKDDILMKIPQESSRANPRLYDIGCYNDNLALMLAPDSDEMIRLEKERRSKLSDLIRPFDYDQLNNLYDLFVPQREKSAEQHYFPKTSKMIMHH